MLVILGLKWINMFIVKFIINLLYNYVNPWHTCKQANKYVHAKQICGHLWNIQFWANAQCQHITYNTKVHNTLHTLKSYHLRKAYQVSICNNISPNMCLWAISLQFNAFGEIVFSIKWLKTTVTYLYYS